jgi:hypothetical protein
MEKFIRTIPKFGGAVNEDVVKWLHNIDAVFDQIQLRPSNKYIAVQYYLTNTAASGLEVIILISLIAPHFDVKLLKLFNYPLIQHY